MEITMSGRATVRLFDDQDRAGRELDDLPADAPPDRPRELINDGELVGPDPIMAFFESSRGRALLRELIREARES